MANNEHVAMLRRGVAAWNTWRDLINARLPRANLYGATLIEANLAGADLSRATLMCANLIGAKLPGVEHNSYQSSFNRLMRDLRVENAEQ
jgi:uncharacterized protein YjbI with pentapeptide repeats